MLRKFIFATVLAVVGVALSGPWALYWLGLYGTKGYPAPPKTIATRELQLEVWRLARGTEEPRSLELNPYNYLPLAAEPGAGKSAILVAWWVASDFNLKHQRHPGMGWWHLSGAALTIWLSRNWSIEQLLSKAAETRLKSAA